MLGIRHPMHLWEMDSGRRASKCLRHTQIGEHIHALDNKTAKPTCHWRSHTPTNKHTSALQMDGEVDNGWNDEADQWSPSSFFDSYDLNLLRGLNHIEVWKWTINVGQSRVAHRGLAQHSRCCHHSDVMYNNSETGFWGWRNSSISYSENSSMKRTQLIKKIWFENLFPCFVSVENLSKFYAKNIEWQRLKCSWVRAWWLLIIFHSEAYCYSLLTLDNYPNKGHNVIRCTTWFALWQTDLTVFPF